MKTRFSFFAVVAFFVVIVRGPALDAAEAMFPFVVSYDAPQNITNVSSFLEAPAGKHGFVRVEGDTFVHDGGEIRFWATNLSGAANFPAHEQSDRIAARLARFGFNCVRLHWMDAWDIFGGWNPKNHTDFDPEQVDRLEYLIYALKERGIYVNVNLHVARWLDDRDGFPHKDKRPTYDKGVGNFYPAMIDKQKEYAKTLLTHVNPYTKLSMVDDPCVAMVEISNEDSIVVEWANYWNGSSISLLPDPYRAELRKQWNQWLVERYQTTEKLRTAWKIVNEPFGDEILKGGDFSAPIEFNRGGWYWQTDDIVDCDAQVRDGVLRMDVRKPGGVSYVPQIGFARFRIEKDVPYTLTLRMRADKAHRIHCSVSQDREPWGVTGTSQPLDVGPEWKTFTFKFFGKETEDATRFCITGLQVGWYELADVSLRTGGNFGFPVQCRLEDGTIPILDRDDAERLPLTTRDWFEFLVEIERRYWVGMYRYLKDELNVKSAVSGTQLGYGSSLVQAELDYCDAHAYWNHPAWPRKEWDVKDWFVRNRALVDAADLGTLGDLAQRRIAGKPYTISEYNHPYPNEFSGEGLPMSAAFGRFQKWNGIFQYTYAHKSETEPEKLTGYFDLDVQSLQLVHSPACAAMFLRGDVRPADATVSGTLDAAKEIDLMAEHLTPQALKLGNIIPAWNNTTPLSHAVEVEVGKDAPKNQTESGSLEIQWKPGNSDDAREGMFTLDAPNVKLFTGFVRGRSSKFKGFDLAIGETLRDFATVSILRNDGAFLLTATGIIHNTDGAPRDYPRENTWDPADAITLEDRWGNAPVLCEGIPLELTMTRPGTWHVWPLDTAGNRRESEPLVFRDGKITLGPEHRTVWYELRPVREK